MVGRVIVTSYVAVFHVRGAPPPLGVDAFSWFLMHLALAMLAFYLKKKKMEAIAFQATH